MKRIKISLLAKIGIAIAGGILCGIIMPDWFTRIALTVNSLFSNFLLFFIPLLIIGLVASGIADLGKDAGRMLGITIVLAYAFTLFAGFGSFFASELILPPILSGDTLEVIGKSKDELLPYFSVDMPPIMSVMTALVFAFVLGIGIAYTAAERLRSAVNEFKVIVDKVISGIIIPLLPVYIFGMFLSMTNSGKAFSILKVFIGVGIVVFILSALLLIIQYLIAGAISKKNPLKLFRCMIPAYFIAFGTQSSAATIPITLDGVRKMGVAEDVGSFVVPMCATVHLAGAIVKLIICAIAIAIIYNLDIPIQSFVSFILMLTITVVAAPGIPGGVVMASIGLMQSELGFDSAMIGLMIATSIAMEGISTATSVSGDGAIAVIVDEIEKKI